ncbi:glycosyltransferase family 4 protein [Tenacibaculum sp. 190524A05c]|uniref:glycosyltransferase family 4 protein n=1 Tax=Tenacibaculum platacis TaxID=3137852 RepID=UPI0031FB6926
MRKNNRVLLIGPLPDPISGVSLANKVVKEILERSDGYSVSFVNTSNPNFSEDLGSFSIKKAWFYFSLNLHLYKVLSSNIIYITPGQTFFGIVKYSFFILLSSLLKKELIIHVHGNHLGDCYQDLKGKKKRLFKYLVKKFSKGIVLSESLKNNLTPFLDPDQIHVLYNFAENYLLDDKEKNFGKLKLVYLSNLMREKGIIYLLDALKKLEENNIPYEAKIAGNIDVNLNAVIQQKLNNLKFTEYIGVVYGNDKKELLHWSNVFILPTFYKMEGQPISILEALASKNCIVTTAHAGIPDIIQDSKNGKFVAKENVESIFDTLSYLSQNLDFVEEKSKFNEIYFQENFSLNNFSKNFINILNA